MAGHAEVVTTTRQHTSFTSVSTAAAIRWLTGGVCRYGIADDTCMPFTGVDNYHEEETSGVDNVQKRLCRICHWNGNCEWKQHYRRYSADEVGRVKGENAMVAEIYARGPIACSLDSEPDAFNKYTSGIITSADLPKPSTTTDHVVVIAGYGIDPSTGMKFWTGASLHSTCSKLTNFCRKELIWHALGGGTRRRMVQIATRQQHAGN